MSYSIGNNWHKGLRANANNVAMSDDIATDATTFNKWYDDVMAFNAVHGIDRAVSGGTSKNGPEFLLMEVSKDTSGKLVQGSVYVNKAGHNVLLNRSQAIEHCIKESGSLAGLSNLVKVYFRSETGISPTAISGHLNYIRGKRHTCPEWYITQLLACKASKKGRSKVSPSKLATLQAKAAKAAKSSVSTKKVETANSSAKKEKAELARLARVAAYEKSLEKN